MLWRSRELRDYCGYAGRNYGTARLDCLPSPSHRPRDVVMAALSLRHNVERMVFPPPIRPLRGATLFPATLAVDGCLHPQRCWAREDNIAQDAIIWQEESSVSAPQWMDGTRGAGVRQG